jgi:hypothetical protein
MIARHWRGWTAVQDADAYEGLLKNKVLPSPRDIEGYRGGYILRHDGPQEVEFVLVNLFDSLESVKRFAGPDYSVRSSNLKQESSCGRSSRLQCTTTSAPALSVDRALLKTIESDQVGEFSSSPKLLPPRSTARTPASGAGYRGSNPWGAAKLSFWHYNILYLHSVPYLADVLQRPMEYDFMEATGLTPP